MDTGKVTTRDVAAHAGVGLATASRALSGEPDASEATRARVLEDAAALGYRRSSVAVGLKRGTTDNVGAAVMSRHPPVVLSPSYMEVIGGVEEVLEAKETWETKGDVPKVVFGTANPVVNGEAYLYYDGADRVIGHATAPLDELLAWTIAEG